MPKPRAFRRREKAQIGHPARMVYCQFVPENSRASKTLPLILLIIGIAAGAATIGVALIQRDAEWMVILGTLTAVAAIVLTFIIALNQNADTDDLRELVESSRALGEKTNQVLVDVHSVLLKVEEQTATRDYGQSAQSVSEDSLGEEEVPDGAGAAPTYADEAIAQLRSQKANLDFDNLLWRPKTTVPPTRGNHGWFVESQFRGNGERWFVRKANGLTVRKAMPREFLEMLEAEAPLDPREIKHDFQLRDHGLAAWYARTYSGELWKVSRSNRNASAGISVTREISEE